MKPAQNLTEIIDRVGMFHAAEQERIRDTVLRWITDPVSPKTNQGGLRMSRVLIILTALASIAFGTFLFFSVAHP